MSRALALLLALVGAIAHAAQAAQAAVPQIADAPFLWEVQSAQTPRTHHYLLGSVHLLPQSAYPLPAALDRAYHAAAGLVLETDLAALADPKMQLQLLEQAQAPNGPDGGLRGQIGAPLYEQVRRYAAAQKLEPAICDRFKAWFCALTLEVLSFSASDYKPELGIDQHYYALASTAQKPVLALEEPAAHLGLFTTMPDALAAELLQTTLDDDTVEGSPAELLQAWRNNDLGKVEQLVAQLRKLHPALYQRLLAGRNQAWLPRLTQLFAGAQPQLVIVGAAHLAGEDGLIALLKAKNFLVTPAQLVVEIAPAPAPK